MKHLFVLWNRIKTHLKEHFLIVLLFLLGIFASTLFYIYYYGDFVKPSAFVTGLEDVVARYTIRLAAPIPVQDERIASLESQGVVTVYATRSIKPSDASDILTVSEKLNYTVQAKKGNNFEYGALYGSVDLNQRDDCIVFSSGDTTFVSVNKLAEAEVTEVSYGGVVLTVIGVHSWGLDGCVPYALFENGTLNVESIQIELPSYLSQNDSAKYSATLQVLFPDAEIVDPYALYANFFQFEDEQRPLDLLKAMGLMLLAVFAFMYLTKHLSDMSLSENIVYRIVGADRSDVVLLSLGEILSLSVVAVVSAIATHIIFYDSFFEKIRISANQPYTLSDYILITGSSLLICVVSSIPFLISFWRKTVIQMKHDVE